jgi:hypothetical protein
MKRSIPFVRNHDFLRILAGEHPEEEDPLQFDAFYYKLILFPDGKLLEDFSQVILNCKLFMDEHPEQYDCVCKALRYLLERNSAFGVVLVQSSILPNLRDRCLSFRFFIQLLNILIGTCEECNHMMVESGLFDFVLSHTSNSEFENYQLEFCRSFLKTCHDDCPQFYQILNIVIETFCQSEKQVQNCQEILREVIKHYPQSTIEIIRESGLLDCIRNYIIKSENEFVVIFCLHILLQITCQMILPNEFLREKFSANLLLETYDGHHHTRFFCISWLGIIDIFFRCNIWFIQDFESSNIEDILNNFSYNKDFMTMRLWFRILTMLSQQIPITEFSAFIGMESVIKYLDYFVSINSDWNFEMLQALPYYVQLALQTEFDFEALMEILLDQEQSENDDLNEAILNAYQQVQSILNE